MVKMKSWNSFVLIAISALHFSSGHRSNRNYLKQDHCYADESNPYLFFASKTAYHAVYLDSNVQTIPDECEARQLWMVIRHGARYPLQKKTTLFQELEKIRDKVIHNHKHHRGNLCEKDLTNLMNWKLDDIPLSESDHLTSQGYNDLEDIGDRMLTKYHNLFKNPYDEHLYKIQYTQHAKTKLSAQAFTSGLFKKEINLPPSTSDDLITRIYPNCKISPIPGANDPPDAGKSERSLFKNGPLVEEVLENINKRLGFEDDDNKLEMEDLDNMYDMCRYAKSWNFEQVSPWCAVFSEKDLQVIEYIGDLSYYYNSGHGYSGNLRTGCPLVKDMIDRFRHIALNENSSEPFGVFYFGHSTTIYNLFARLGIAKDSQHLTHENYEEMSNRKWHTSVLGPFSANFAAVFLTCKTGEKNRVVFFHNEAPFRFKECKGYVCNWQVIERMYGNITRPETCNFNLCEKKEKKSKENRTTVTERNNKTSNVNKTDYPGTEQLGTDRKKEENNMLAHMNQDEAKTKAYRSIPGNDFGKEYLRKEDLGERDFPSSPKPKNLSKNINFMYFLILIAAFVVMFLIYHRVQFKRGTQAKFMKMQVENAELANFLE